MIHVHTARHDTDRVTRNKNLMKPSILADPLQNTDRDFFVVDHERIGCIRRLVSDLSVSTTGFIDVLFLGRSEELERQLHYHFEYECIFFIAYLNKLLCILYSSCSRSRSERTATFWSWFIQ